MKISKETTTVLKAILPILIVLHHLAFKTQALNYTWLLNTGPAIVSIFFFISGYGLYYSLIHKKGYLKNFYSKRLYSLLVPYAFSIILYQIESYFCESYIPLKNAHLFSSGDTNWILPASWYVIVIFVLYYIFKECFNIKTSHKYKIIGISLSCLVLIIILKMIGFPAYWYISIGAFISGIYYYYFCEIKPNIIKIRYKILYIILLFLFIYYCSITHSIIWKMLSLSFFPIAIIIILNKLNFEKISSYNIIIFLSGISYEIYLTHVIAYRFLRSKILYIQSDFIYILFCFALTFILSLIIRIITIKLKKI